MHAWLHARIGCSLAMHMQPPHPSHTTQSTVSGKPSLPDRHRPLPPARRRARHAAAADGRPGRRRRRGAAAAAAAALPAVRLAGAAGLYSAKVGGYSMVTAASLRRPVTPSLRAYSLCARCSLFHQSRRRLPPRLTTNPPRHRTHLLFHTARDLYLRRTAQPLRLGARFYMLWKSDGLNSNWYSGVIVAERRRRADDAFWGQGSPWRRWEVRWNGFPVGGPHV
jgi:hypothetical protein